VRGALVALVAAIALPPGGVMAEPAAVRLLVLDLPYAEVWASVVRTVQTYPLERAADGVIETRRVERAPRSDEPGVERVAERVTVRVEATGRLVTRVTVDVALEGLRDGRWGPLEDDGVAARTLLDRIRAGLG
jgi:hypothetical protein